MQANAAQSGKVENCFYGVITFVFMFLFCSTFDEAVLHIS